MPWFYNSGKDGWKPYSDAAQIIIEHSHARSENFCWITVNGNNYLISFYNNDGKFNPLQMRDGNRKLSRRIKCSHTLDVPKAPEPAPAPPNYLLPSYDDFLASKK